MGLEIERKFLVRNDGWRKYADSGTRYLQGYFTGTDHASVRVRIDNEHGYLNIKGAELTVRRREYEYRIPRQDALEMLDHLCAGPIIEKTRYHVRHGEYVWEVDVFAGVNEGLVLAEIELGDENESFDVPDWAGDDVSDDPRYYNVFLIKHPYSTWHDYS